MSRSRSLAAFLLGLHLGGCTTWQPVQISPRQYIEAEQPYKIRFRDQHGDWLEVEYPRAVGDTIAGTTTGIRPTTGPQKSVPIRLAVTDLPPIEAKRVNVPQTVVYTSVFVTVIAGAVLCVTGLCDRGEPVSR